MIRRRTFRRSSKYGAKRTEVDGITFHSAKEAKRWGELRLLEQDGQIRNLNRQVTFELHGVNGLVVCKYVVDFTYIEDLEFVAEDTKGFRTADYKIKRKLFVSEYGKQWEHRES